MHSRSVLRCVHTMTQTAFKGCVNRIIISLSRSFLTCSFSSRSLDNHVSCAQQKCSKICSHNDTNSIQRLCEQCYTLPKLLLAVQTLNLPLKPSSSDNTHYFQQTCTHDIRFSIFLLLRIMKYIPVFSCSFLPMLLSLSSVSRPNLSLRPNDDTQKTVLLIFKSQR